MEVPEIIATQSRGFKKETVQTGGGQYHNQEIHDHGSKSFALIALIIGSVALGIALVGLAWAIAEANEATRTADVATMRVEGLTRAMIAHGIKDTYPHLPGEDD